MKATLAVRPGPVLSAEAVKQLRRPRTAAVVGAVVAVEVGVCILVSTARQGPERLGDWGSVVPRSTGFALPLVALNAMSLLAFPVIASIYAGDSIAGEAAYGSLRYLAARPVSRSRIFAAKAATSGALTAATIIIGFVAALIFGLISFGLHPLTVVDLQHSDAFHLSAATLDPGSAMLRGLAVLGFVLVSSASVFAFSLLLSTLTEQAFAAIAGGIGFTFVSRALDNVPGLQALSPGLPVTDSSTTAWTGLLTQPIRTGAIQHLVLVQTIYFGVLIAIGAFLFDRTDLVS